MSWTATPVESKTVIWSSEVRRGARADGPIIKVNCSAIPSTLIESELLGHEKGAFTGAVDARPGRFELAEGGTLFLDEIGDLPGEVLAKLLRVLQDGEVQRLGATRARAFDVRIVTATNRMRSRLSGDVRDGRQWAWGRSRDPVDAV